MAAVKDISIGYAARPQLGVALSSFTINQSTDNVTWMGAAAETATITHIGFHISAINGTATTWRAAIMGIDGTGIEDGVVKGGGSPASVTFTNAAVAVGWNWLALANSIAMVRGENFCLEIEYSSGTAPSAGVNDLSLNWSAGWGTDTIFPYTITNDNGTRTRNRTAPQIFGYKSSSKAYGFPYSATYAPVFNSSSSPAIYAAKFNIPSNTAGTYQVRAFEILWTPPTAGTTAMDVRIYSGTSVIQDVAIDTDQVQSVTSRLFQRAFDSDALATLNFNQDYYLAFAPTTTTNITLRGFSVADAIDWEAWRAGQNFTLATLAAGTWTETTTSRLFCEILITDITNPSSTTTYIFQCEG